LDLHIKYPATFAKHTITDALCLQIFSNKTVGGGVGVYWMLYTGVNYEPMNCPAGLRVDGFTPQQEGNCWHPVVLFGSQN
jgi:hypothetical protein